MSASDFHHTLVARLIETVEPSMAVQIADDLERTSESDALPTVLELLDEMHAVSKKAAGAVIEALPELHRRGLASLIPRWLDLCVALAGSSGAAALRYCKESPVILSVIEPPSSRHQVLSVALELAETDPNVTLEFLRKAPELSTVVPVSELAAWAEVGLEVTRWDYVLGIEFYQQCPAAARTIPLADVRAWLAFGMKLITRNSLGKTDYLGTLEFFRTSPAILGDLDGDAVKNDVITLGSVLADRDPQSAISFLAAAPSLLRRLSSDGWRTHVLQYGTFIAERDAEATAAYLRRCPEIVVLLGDRSDARAKFDEWFKGGMEVLEYSVEGARAYFALETKKALASIEEALSGVPLRQMARSLKLFAQALCGTDIVIQSLPDPGGESRNESARARVSADGRTIALPAVLRRYPTREDNARLYTVMTAHEAGHLEYGTYTVPFSLLGDLLAEAARRYGRLAEDIRTLADLFELYPQPGLIRDLWIILEDARVECRLQLEYPGLARDLAVLAREAVTTRSLLHGMSVREMAVDCLLLLSTAEPGTVRIPDAIADVVNRLWAVSQTILTPSATAADTIRLADRVYVILEEMVAGAEYSREAEAFSPPRADVGAGPKASEETSGNYRSVTNWAYRGEMNPDLVKDQPSDDTDGQPPPGDSSDDGAGSERTGAARTGANDSRAAHGQGEQREESSVAALTAGTMSPSVVEQTLAVQEDGRPRRQAALADGASFVYDEWDGVIRDYRTGWCRVVERVALSEDAACVAATLAAHGPAVRLLRRYFESIRPPALRRVLGQVEGDDLDLDAAIARAVDRRAGSVPTERIYMRREKRDRDVAVAFLVDLSGSTSRRIESDGRRIIDVEKEGLILLSQALDAIGDQYAIYGYSGQGRHAVDFVVVKEFDEPMGRSLPRIGGVEPRTQNRDGAAIRHAAHKLSTRDARVRLLILISDGKPLDDAYTDEYALEDTKMALQEVGKQGIDAFCITVDREADDYLRRMYGDVRFLIIDWAAALPEKLPRIYRRLTA